MPPWPALNCSWPVVTSATGCDFIQAAPPDVQAQIERIVGHFRSDRRFHTSAVKHVLDGSTRIEQKRLKIRLTVLWSTLERLKPTQSAIVELGTFVGTTAMGMRMVMDTLGYRYPEHVLHVFDSWEGLPAPRSREGGLGQLKAGGLVSSVDAYLDRFRRAGLDPPYIHRGFFGDIPDSEYPSNINFAFYDGDFYSSIVDSFKKTWPKIVPGGTVMIDDYMYDSLEGVKEAIDEFLLDKPDSRLARPLNVSHKRTFVPSWVPFQLFEAVITAHQGAYQARGSWNTHAHASARVG